MRDHGAGDLLRAVEFQRPEDPCLAIVTAIVPVIAIGEKSAEEDEERFSPCSPLAL